MKNAMSIKNISNKELAKCMGVKPAFASQIRNGKRKLPLNYCVKVSETFGIPLSELRNDIGDILSHDNNNAINITANA